MIDSSMMGLTSLVDTTMTWTTVNPAEAPLDTATADPIAAVNRHLGTSLHLGGGGLVNTYNIL